ncbi:hypothetical protein CAEBREN_02510 [Caenorhabditis brenneri]|uniref:Uncharacterized protein n=1 Tax=Caenorhabditis brenneri TaxID=135651 RepID=G0P7H6_CAEBE|nr:hypothetical protein CAEBREN_02510 [Caenorhabditis brenneri]
MASSVHRRLRQKTPTVEEEDLVTCASTSQYSSRDGPPESFYAVSRAGVQLNSWRLDMSEMDKCIKKVLFEVTLVAGEKKYKLSDGIPMMKGE